MKTKTIFKSLLVAAGLLVGSSAWAEDVYTGIYNRALTGTGDGVTTALAWADADLTDWGGDANLSIDAANGLFFNTTKPGAAYSATKSFSVTENAKVKYQVSWYVANSTGRTSNYEYIKFGDKIVLGYNSNYHFYLSTTGAATEDNDLTAQLKTPGVSEISIIFNTATKTVESFSFRGTDITSKVAGALEGGFNSITFGFQRGGSTSNWAYPNGLHSIVVSECKQAVSVANYTVNYQLSGTTVKTVAGSSVIGAEITADVAIDGEEEGYVGNHYLITAADAPSMTLVADAASNVLNVPVRAPYTATFNLTTSIAGVAGDPVATVLTETDDKVCNWNYAFPLYKEKDGIYYISDNQTTFGETGTFTDGEVINKTISYTNAEADVVYFYDGAKGTNYSLSNGSSENIGAQNARDRGLSVGTLPAGTYMFVVNITAANRRSVVIRQSTKDPIALVGTSNEDKTIGIKSAIFTLNEETDNLWINGANSGTAKTNQSEDYDYVLVKKVPASITATIGSDAIATFSSEYAVDFSAEDGVTVYTAKVNDAKTAVVLTEVESKKVPANTGVILKGDAGTYNAAVVASAAALENNQLAVSDGTSNVKGAYVLTKSGDKVVFGVWDSETPLSKGRVYLPADVVDVVLSGAKTLNIIFEGETTGINDVSRLNNAEMTSDKVVFNLNGQRIAAPQKGINIINGRKYIVK